MSTLTNDVRRQANSQVSKQDVTRAKLEAKAEQNMSEASADVQAAGRAIKEAGHDSKDAFAYTLVGVYTAGATVGNLGQAGWDVAKATGNTAAGTADLVGATVFTSLAGGAVVVEATRDGVYNLASNGAEDAVSDANRTLANMGYTFRYANTETQDRPNYVRSSDALMAITNELVEDAAHQYGDAAQNLKGAGRNTVEAAEYLGLTVLAPAAAVVKLLEAAGDLAVSAANTGKAGANVAAAYGVRVAGFAVEAQKQGLLTKVQLDLLRAEMDTKIANFVKNPDKNELGLSASDMAQFSDLSNQIAAMVSSDPRLKAIAQEKQILPPNA